MKGTLGRAPRACLRAATILLTFTAFQPAIANPYDPDFIDSLRPLPNSPTTPLNRAPVITGAPSTTATAGTAYAFTPSANDADGDVLIFSVANLPAWARFEAQSGRISGTPGPEHVGTYPSILVSVSDGEAVSSLPVFGIQVDAYGNGSVALSWTAPTANEDGSYLANLAGYKIYWGQTPGSYPNSVTISNPGLTTYVLEGLPAGTYEFVSTAYNSEGTESEYSNTVRRVVW